VTEGPFFVESLSIYGVRTAVVDAGCGRAVTYRQLDELTAKGAELLAGPAKRVIYLAARNDLDSVVCYLSALRSGHAVCLDQADSVSGASVVGAYCPEWILCREESTAPDTSHCPLAGRLHGFEVRACPAIPPAPVFPHLALLLLTSGSTGSPKAVRLSYGNIIAAASQARAAVEVTENDNAFLALPFTHVYGLSVLHSLLTVGGTVTLSPYGIMNPKFWELLESSRPSLCPLVPAQMRFARTIGSGRISGLHGLRVTLSGSRIEPELYQWIAGTLAPFAHIYSMYGMTECCGRVTALAPAEFCARPGSVGRAVEGGSIRILATGEIEYAGANVMLGYASSRDDLSFGDHLCGSIRTGDLGYTDADGCLYVTGRLTRLSKVLGRRIDLEDIEGRLRRCFEVAAVSDDDVITLHYEGNEERRLRLLAASVADELRLPRGIFRFRSVRELPRSTSGKVLYGQLRSQESQTLL
jgi:acyl-CoA synthetase (AMP-forming)/AMP-acid ligase II